MAPSNGFAPDSPRPTLSQFNRTPIPVRQLTPMHRRWWMWALAIMCAMHALASAQSPPLTVLPTFNAANPSSANVISANVHSIAHFDSAASCNCVGSFGSFATPVQTADPLDALIPLPTFNNAVASDNMSATAIAIVRAQATLADWDRDDAPDGYEVALTLDATGRDATDATLGDATINFALRRDPVTFDLRDPSDRRFDQSHNIVKRWSLRSTDAVTRSDASAPVHTFRLPVVNFEDFARREIGLLDRRRGLTDRRAGIDARGVPIAIEPSWSSDRMGHRRNRWATGVTTPRWGSMQIDWSGPGGHHDRVTLPVMVVPPSRISLNR